jgi:ornithine cyclodeaminase
MPLPKLFTPTVTASAQPVFDGSKIKAGATISAVGTYEPHKHEIDTETVRRASKIVCDWKDAVLSESGDLLIPIAEGIIKESDVQGSLGDVLLGRNPGRENDEEIILYETVGVAMQDLAAAKIIYDKALECGAGTRWE